ncbi:hypothetical protein J9345_18980 [Bacillus subtilis subsp. subtilis]|uniref:hypothetical protein n=2 Tax=Bacillus subtilis TaxID=1423 RepID=UPI00065D43FC|nr:hypothetical protein [Bacillus subtilis]KMN94576.1 hypothetical protein VL08_13110 [Bacillus subtilis]MBP3048638.1 hypothetical protein [Bacillus subtilis subsp. subtilis]
MPKKEGGTYMTIPLLKLNLQFFSEDTGGEAGNSDSLATDETVNQEGNTDEQVSSPTEQPSNEEKTDPTPSDEDVKKEILKSLGFENFDEAKAAVEDHRKYLESQKTEQQKQQEAYEALEQSNKEKDEELFKANAKLSAFKAGVDEESLDDVLLLAKAQMNDDVDIETAIKKVVEKYPQFTNSEVTTQVDKPRFSQGQHQSKGGKMDAFLTGLGLKGGTQ